MPPPIRGLLAQNFLFDLDQRAFAFVFRPAMPPPTIDVVTGAVLSTLLLSIERVLSRSPSSSALTGRSETSYTTTGDRTSGCSPGRLTSG